MDLLASKERLSLNLQNFWKARNELQIPLLRGILKARLIIFKAFPECPGTLSLLLPTSRKINPFFWTQVVDRIIATVARSQISRCDYGRGRNCKVSGSLQSVIYTKCFQRKLLRLQLHLCQKATVCTHVSNFPTRCFTSESSKHVYRVCTVYQGSGTNS